MDGTIQLEVEPKETVTNGGRIRKLQHQISRQFPAKKPLPVWFLAFIFVIIGLLFMCSYLAIFNFPTGLKTEDAQRNPMSFIAENAYEHVRYLSVDIGSRSVGTVQNEVLAVNYLLGQISDIIALKSPEVDIEVRHELVEGSIDHNTHYKTLYVYRGLQNIVVKLSPRNVDPKLNYILLNSHFDTKPLSPGAGDDATMVGVMLELLRVFSKFRYLNHPLVFLFNGGEEIGLQAAHGYIRSGEWANKTGVLLNLEASGGGGKEVVFQARSEHPWLMSAYRRAALYPLAMTLAQEIWEGGLVQSDTDYSEFKLGFDKLPAMDFAHTHDSYTYHTRHDDISIVILGSLQHTGDNILGLVKEMDTRSEIDNYLEAVDETGNNVFYDFLGLFLIFYNHTAAVALNSVVFVLLTLVTGWCAYQIKKKEGITFSGVLIEYLFAFLIQLVTICLAFGVNLFIAWFMDICNRPLSYYSNNWLLFGIYFVPFFGISALMPYLYIKFREKKTKTPLSTSYYVQMALHAHCNLISILLIVLTIMGINSAYLVLLSTAFYFVSTFINVVFGLVNKGNTWLYLHCFAQIIPALYYFYVLIQLILVMIPAVARAYDGALSNPDITISMIVVLLTLLSTGFYSPIFILFRHRKILLGLLAVIFVAFVIMAFTPLGFPYQERRPQRFTVWHTKREFFDFAGNLRHNDSGYYVHGYDRNGPKTLFDHLPRLHDGHLTSQEDCDRFMMCGQPWWRINYVRNRFHNYYIPAEEPRLPTILPKLTLKSTTEYGSTRTRYDFAIAGPHFMNIQISPQLGVKIVEMSIVKDVSPGKETWNGREFYFIGYHHGIRDFYYRDYDFYLIVERPQDWAEPYSFDIAVSALWVHGEEVKSPEFVDFTNQFPVWTNCQNWSSYHGAFQF